MRTIGLSGRFTAFGVWAVFGFAIVLAVAMTVRAAGPPVQPERARHAKRMGWDPVAYQGVFNLMERAERDRTLGPEDWSLLQTVLERGETPMRIEALAVLPLLRKGDRSEEARAEARRYLNDTNAKVRAHALESLYFMRDPSWRESAIGLRADQTPDVRNMIAMLEAHAREQGKRLP